MPGYLRVLRIPLRAGRDFTLADDATAPLVVVVDESLARRYWPGDDAVGKRINPNGPPGQWATIIGVVAHVHNAGPQVEGEPQIYVPYLQDPQGPLFPVARATAGAQVAAVAFRNAVRQLNPDLPIARLRPMDDVVAHAFARQRFNTILLGAFGSIALVLASIGLYGVLSFVVAQRSHEIGIRLALGGRPRDVVRMVVGQGLWLAAAGLVVGLLATAASARVLSTLLFGVASTDPTTYIAVSALLLVVAFAAAYVPARRATRVDPLTAMRDSA
jgi:putative ABC transport system permease protein